MKKKKTKKVPKTGAIWKLSKEEATLAQKPHYNAYICGNGIHGDTKYNRTKQKRSWKKELNNERASYRGPLPFYFRLLCKTQVLISASAPTP